MKEDPTWEERDYGESQPEAVSSRVPHAPGIQRITRMLF